MTYSEANELARMAINDAEELDHPKIKCTIYKQDAYKEDSFQVQVRRVGNWSDSLSVTLGEYQAMRKYVFAKDDPMRVHEALTGAA